MLYTNCPTCGTIFADKELKFEEGINIINCKKNKNDTKNKNEVGKLLDDLKITNYCCRMRFITYIDLINTII